MLDCLNYCLAVCQVRLPHCVYKVVLTAVVYVVVYDLVGFQLGVDARVTDDNVVINNLLSCDFVFRFGPMN